MKSYSFTSSESELLSKINSGFCTFDDLKSNVSFSEKMLNRVIESLVSKNIIKYDEKEKIYKYDSPINGEKLILEGNLLLPTTILKYDNCTIIGRGKWYKFPPNFDIRRIIWNVELPEGHKKCTLVDLIRESVMTEKKSRVKQSSEPMYKKLVNKIVPYSSKLGLRLNVVGDDYIDISFIFRKTINTIVEDDMKIEFFGLTTRGLIKTDELINELRKDPSQRNYKNIKLDTIVKFSDFVFLNNEIPYEYDSSRKILSYVKITGVKGILEIEYRTIDGSGEVKTLNTVQFEDLSVGISKLQEHFNGYAKKMIEEADLMIEGLPDVNRH